MTDINFLDLLIFGAVVIQASYPAISLFFYLKVKP